MRLWIAGTGLLLATSLAHAELYGNARFSFFVDVPPAFSVADPEPENGDGRTFHTADNTADLIAAGGWIIDGDFADEIAQTKGFAKENGWTLTYEGKVGASSAVFSGEKDGRIFYQKEIATCAGKAHAGYRLEYPASDKKKYDGVIEGLNASLKAGEGSCS